MFLRLVLFFAPFMEYKKIYNDTAWILFIHTELSGNYIAIRELLPEDIRFMTLIIVIATWITWRALSEV